MAGPALLTNSVPEGRKWNEIPTETEKTPKEAWVVEKVKALIIS